jgi:uncharacterized protein (DUF427 family)
VARIALEPVTWRVRILAAGGRTVADSHAALLALHRDAQPAYAFPEADIQHDALPAAAWIPVEDRPGYATLEAGRIETILEEDEPVVGPHPRSPYHRADLVHSSRHVVATLAGERLAETVAPMALFETDEPTRFYFAQADVQRHLLEPSETVTSSPYVGEAVWFSARVGGELHADVAWTYRFPIAQMPRIAGLLAFRDELVREL